MIEVRARERGERMRADAVADHLHGARAVDRATVGGAVDDVVGRKALRRVQLVRLEHAQADVDDHVRNAADVHGDECEAVARVDRVQEARRRRDVVHVLVQGGLELERELLLCTLMMFTSTLMATRKWFDLKFIRCKKTPFPLDMLKLKL